MLSTYGDVYLGISVAKLVSDAARIFSHELDATKTNLDYLKLAPKIVFEEPVYDHAGAKNAKADDLVLGCFLVFSLATEYPAAKLYIYRMSFKNDLSEYMDRLLVWKDRLGHA